MGISRSGAHRWRCAALVLLLIAASCAGSIGSNERACGPAGTPTDRPEALEIDEPVEVWAVDHSEATFSSPRAIDLTGDGTLDIVQGFGQDTFGERMSSVIATNGATGEELWRSSGHEDLIGSATFASLGGDDTIDVVIGGRRGALIGIDGATGEMLWSFDEQNDRWFNFYTSQVIADQNGDGVVDLVAANGGLRFDQPEEGGGLPDPDERQLGYMFVISGSDGSVIASTPVPDRRESYMSAAVLPGPPGVSEIDVLIGTGGETLPGSLWRVGLDDLLAKDLSSAIEVVSGGTKGIIATPSLGHFTSDCVLDIVVQAFDGTVSAVDGATNNILWANSNPGFETYSTPTLGYFVGDDTVPDVFASVARGIWPEYESSDYLLIDGATGETVWRETVGTFGPSGFAAADVDGDGRDEVIFGANSIERNEHQLYLLDPTEGALQPLGAPLAQTTFSSPWLGDLDGDGQLELVTTESAYQSQGAAVVRRFSLGVESPALVSWGAYIGTHGDARLIDEE